MDHSDCRKTIGHLEDDLEYNLGRKEQLKSEVKRLDEDNDNLRKMNFKNAEVALKKESVFKKLIETLRKELDEVKSGGHIESLKSENKALKEKLESWEKEDERISNCLKTENNNLQLKITDLLKCNECDVKFDEKSSMMEHILSNHSRVIFKCGQCDKHFPDRGLLKRHATANHVAENLSCSKCEKNFEMKQTLFEHVIREHSSKLKNNLQKRLNELTKKITDQRIKLHEDLFTLKHKDMKKKGNCNCKGKFCKINHSRFRWTMSKADDFFSKLILILPEYQNSEATASLPDQCDKGGKMCENIEGMKTLNEKDHAPNDVSETQESILGSFSYDCELCEQVMDDTNDLQNHIETQHSQDFKCKLCDHEFLEDSSLWKHIESEHVLTYKCQKCEMSFIREKNLEKHIGTDHAENLLESTFFNPSAVN